MSITIQNSKTNRRPKCGIVMPISAMDDLSADHWLEVKGLIIEVADDCGYDCDLVSAADFSGVIQKRIVQNLYLNDIVICDVSKQNANVMFELGLRLAFDKATIVIVDDETKISFDTSPIEHLIYPRDLRHGKILVFKDKLKALIKGTAEKSKAPEYSTFLKDFGTFEVKGLESKDIQFNEYVMSALEKLSVQVNTIMNDQRISRPEITRVADGDGNRISIGLYLRKIVKEVVDQYESTEFYYNDAQRNIALDKIRDRLQRNKLLVSNGAIAAELKRVIDLMESTNA